jgi:RNA polymerase sigma factor (sigma-70 family)
MCSLARSGGARRRTYPLRGEEILAAVPSIGRAVRVEGAPAPEADLTRALYEQYANQIFRYCVHQLGSREEAEDAVQSTFLNAFRGIKRGVVPELESAWLFKIAHNVCLSRRRTSWRRGRIESPTDFDVVEEMTPAPSRRSDELMGLQDVLEQMPDNQRRAILLREWQGLSYREIAEELELSQAAVETLIFRARRSLAAGLEQPPEAKKRKLVRGADLGNVLAGIKSLLLGGGAAAKIAATVAVVSAGTVVAAAPVQQHRAHSHRPTAPATSQAVSTAPASSGRSSVAGPAASFPAAGSEHGATAPGRLKAANFATLGSAPGGTLSSPDDSAVAAPPVEPVPVATPPAVAPPEQVVPQPAAGTPQPATPTPAPNDKSKSERGTTPSPKGGDSQGNGGNGDPKGRDSEGSTTPPPAATPTVQPGGSAPSTGTDAKGSDAKGNGDKADDSKKATTPGVTPPASGTAPAPDATTQPGNGNGDAKKGDSDKKNASTDTSPPAPAASVTPPANPAVPDPAAPAPVMSVLANGGAPGPAAAGGGKSKDKPKDSGKGNDK